MNRNGIVCAGNWIIDRVKTIDGYPREETLANILGESRQNGGCAFNVAVDLTRLGAGFPIFGIGVIGDDEDGAFVRAVCRENSIHDVGLVTATGVATSYTDVMTDSRTGRRTFFHARGANALLGPQHFDFADCSAAHLHLGYLLLLDGLDGPPSLAVEVLRAAKEAGLTTSIDLVSEASDRFTSVVSPTLPFVDYCFMNEFELSQTSGIEVPESGALRRLAEAADRVFDLGLRGTLVVHSPRFAYVRSCGSEGALLECAPVTEIRGTVGAGDAFAAGFLFGVQEGRGLVDAAGWGILAAVSSLLGEGASNGIKPMKELLEHSA